MRPSSSRRSRWRAASSNASRASTAGSPAASPSSPSSDIWPSSARRGRGGEARVGGELGELVGAPGRVEEVGGDHRVVGEVEASPSAARGEQALARPTAQVLEVVGDERAAAQLGGQRAQVGASRRSAGARLRSPPSGRRGSRSRSRPRRGRRRRPSSASISSSSATARPGIDLVDLVLEALDHDAQLELVGDLAQARAVLRPRHHLLQVQLALDVVLRRSRAPWRSRASSAWLVRFSLRLAPLISSIDSSTFSIEPKRCSRVRRGLVADPWDAGDVVRGVALQPDQVGNELGRDPVALDHALAVVDLGVGDAARGRHHPHPVADQLVDVAVAGDDHHRDLRLARAPASGSRSGRRPRSPPP